MGRPFWCRRESCSLRPAVISRVAQEERSGRARAFTAAAESHLAEHVHGPNVARDNTALRGLRDGFRNIENPLSESQRIAA